MKWPSWMLAARERDWSFSISTKFSWLDGSRDICQACGKERRFHRREGDHKFVEKEKDKEK